jgi:hypothetical protein
MQMATTNLAGSLALLRWPHIRFFHHHMRHGEVIWLAIGLVLIGVAVLAFLRSERRWS